MSPVREWLRANWMETLVVGSVVALVSMGWRLTVDVAVLQNDVGSIKGDVSELKSDVRAIRDTLARMESRLGVKVEHLEKDQIKFDNRLTGVESHLRPVSQPAPKSSK